jgi:ABC-type branched-subunit amino acid transport system substrate-binding protein
MAYHVRSGYDDEYRRMISYVKDFNMQRVGYVYLKDTSQANQRAMSAALNAVGLKLTVSVPLDRNQKSFDAEVKTLLDSKLDCVLFTTNAQPISEIVAGMRAARYPGFYFSSSFAGQALINDMVEQRQTVIMSQVVPRPNAIATGVVQQYRSAMAALGGKARIGFTSLEGYIAGRAAIEATRSASKGGGITRARFKEALAGLNVDLGGYKLQFSASNPQGSRFVDVIALDRSGRIIG